MKLLYVSSSAVPVMIKLAAALNDITESRTLFYTEAWDRPAFWRNFPLNDSCEVLADTVALRPGKYFSTSVFEKAKEFNPDALILSGFTSPSNYALYRWAKRNRKRVIVFSEVFWVKELGAKDRFWQRRLVAGMLSKIYADVDLVLSVGRTGVDFFVDYCGFPANRVKESHYPVDMSKHLLHPLRQAKSDLVFLFPHRLVPLYNPLLTLNWFSNILLAYPDCKLKMNSFGHLRQEVELRISNLNIADRVEFLDDIQEWDRLHEAYRDSDIMLSTKSLMREGGDWSIAELECLASGLGVIAYRNATGLANLFAKNNAGHLIDDPNDTASVIRAVETYATDRDLLRTHGTRNREVVKEFSIEATARHYCDSIGELF